MCPGKPGSGGCSSAPQGKVRLWVNPDRDQFNCWHCGFQGGSLAPLMVRGSAEQREYLGEREGVRRKREPERPPCTGLPPGYRPFRLSGSPEEAPYLHYLRGRGVTEGDVALYRMGYVEAGRYRGRVVVPSFDAHGLVNFWSARSIHSTEDRFRYMLPECSKDVVSNEHLVDWSRPVYLVEGAFDEVAVGPQAIALYGKFMPPKLALRLVERKPPMVNVCLDQDAAGEALDLVERLLGYDVPCSFVEMEGKDPASWGRTATEEAAARALPVSGTIDLARIGLGI